MPVIQYRDVPVRDHVRVEVFVDGFGAFFNPEMRPSQWVALRECLVCGGAVRIENGLPSAPALKAELAHRDRLKAAEGQAA